MTKIENKVNDPNTAEKSYWKIINRVINKFRASKVQCVYSELQRKSERFLMTYFHNSLSLLLMEVY